MTRCRDYKEILKHMMNISETFALKNENKKQLKKKRKGKKKTKLKS